MSEHLQASHNGSALEVEETPALRTLKENAYRQNQMIDSLAAAIYTCDRNGYIKSYNKAAVELWGREPEIGKDLWCGSWKIFEPDGVTPLPLDSCPMAIALKEGHTVRGREIIVERPDGVRRNIMPHPDPVFDSSGALVEAVNLLVDITELKEKESVIQESEKRYKQIANELQTALKTEEEFLSIASHELKTPITAIKLFIEVLQDSDESTSGFQKENILNRMQMQVGRLTKLVQELLDASSIKSGNLLLHLEEASINEMVDEIVNDLRSTITSHTFNIHTTANIKVKCDKYRIEQVINNLLTNAVKYSDTASAINIFIEDCESNVQVSVQDFGNGIPSELMPRIFDRFFRAHGKNKGMLSSVGLGLYISKDIIQKHGGKIWAESVPGKGSTFHFTLPRV
jgi:signal transduction histidine kinase